MQATVSRHHADGGVGGGGSQLRQGKPHLLGALAGVCVETKQVRRSAVPTTTYAADAGSIINRPPRSNGMCPASRMPQAVLYSSSAPVKLPSLQRGQQEFTAARPAAKLDVRISVSCSAVRVSSPSNLLIDSRVSDCRI